MWIEYNGSLYNLSQYCSILKWNDVKWNDVKFGIYLFCDNTESDNREELYFKTEAERDAVYEVIKAKVLHGRE